jgi:hypothetical protein
MAAIQKARTDSERRVAAAIEHGKRLATKEMSAQFIGVSLAGR